MYSLSNQNKLYSWAYFALVVIVALVLYKDFGLTWDEPTQRGIGTAAYNYVQFGDRHYLEITDRIYGVGFELPLIYLEHFFNLKDTHDIYQFRHLVYVLFFAFACFIFFRLNLKLFQKVSVAIIPTLILLLTPRIFAHAFFNSKDIPFLCMYVICYYALFNYLLKSSYRNIIILALCAGLLVNFRIMGILFFSTALFCILVNWIQKRKFRFGIHSLLFILLAAGALYASWPYLWEQPFMRFQHAYKMMSKFPWLGTMLFRGTVIHQGEQLTNYLFTWIGITIPVFYMIITMVGVLTFLVQAIKKPLKIFESPMKLMGWVFLVNAITPLVAVLYLKSVLYDDWRQLYFIYPPSIIFIGYLFFYLRNWKPKFAAITALVCFGYMGFIGVKMVQLHPFEHIYFNETVSKKSNYILNNYDQDYWGTSFYNGLKYILAHDDADTIPIFAFHDPLIRNMQFLTEKERGRLYFSHYMDPEDGKYYLTTFRFDYPDLIGTYHYKKILYEIRRQGSPILRIWSH